MIFDLQVKNTDFGFSSKSGALGIFLFENITFKLSDVMFYDSFRHFQIVTAVILLYAKQIFSDKFLRLELSMVARLIYQ